MKEEYLLKTVDWAEKEFGSLQTGNAVKKRDITRAIKKGYVKSAGLCAPVDEDCCEIEGRKEKEGFILTDKGRAFLRKKIA